MVLALIRVLPIRVYTFFPSEVLESNRSVQRLYWAIFSYINGFGKERIKSGL